MNEENETVEEEKELKKTPGFEEFPKWKFGKPFGIMNKREKILKDSIKKQ